MENIDLLNSQIQMGEKNGNTHILFHFNGSGYMNIYKINYQNKDYM